MFINRHVQARLPDDFFNPNFFSELVMDEEDHPHEDDLIEDESGKLNKLERFIIDT